MNNFLIYHIINKSASKTNNTNAQHLLIENFSAFLNMLASYNISVHITFKNGNA